MKRIKSYDDEERRIGNGNSDRNMTAMTTEYELIIIENKGCGEIIVFKSNAIMNDSNDIISEAIRRGFIGESCRKNVRIARGYIEYEYEYIGNGKNKF